MRFANMIGNKFFRRRLLVPAPATTQGHAVRHEGAQARPLRGHRARPFVLFGDFDPFGDFEISFLARRVRDSGSWSCRCAIVSGCTARRISGAGHMAGCCSG